MVFAENTRGLKPRSHALQGIFFLFIFSFLGLPDLRIFASSFSFMLIPMIVLFLWPRQSDPVFSMLGAFMGGLLVDILTGGAIGSFALVYVVCFYIFRPDLRLRMPPLTTVCVEFGVWLAVAFTIIIAQNLLLDSSSINLISLVRSALVTLIVFPLCYSIRKSLRTLIFADEETDI
ncbi:MAG: hypothetical protein GDA39_08525 [Hyphomonadaceae bacterium]|nr:hypothetical protein [Hyphomonadaceae bacterium]MBC6412900.1 hypothetical protein [Hyphomonadaceae bacterium]